MKTLYNAVSKNNTTFKKSGLLLLLIIMISGVSQANIRRVGFFAAPVAGVDYATFAAAYGAAAAGDTILVFPGAATLTQTFTKRLVVIGPGNWLNPNSTPKGNADMQAFAGETALSQVIFNAGSEGSIIMGFNGGNYYVAVSNITIRRNRELTVQVAYPSINSITNLQCLENYRLNFTSYAANGSTISNLNVSNNLMERFTTAAGNIYSGNISNNVWAYDGSLSAALNGGGTTMTSATALELGGGAYLFQNNIFASYTSATVGSSANYFGINGASNSVFNYNMALNSNAPQTWNSGTGNVITPIGNASTIFAAFPAISTTSADARYQLHASSPALTVGAGGTPIGMFAGTSPYKLSTIPSIPTIYQLSSPQGNNPPGNTIQINLSTRGNN
ncbi:MAG: hypothetical protein V4722_24760 [Bacteroidota bacterium]